MLGKDADAGRVRRDWVGLVFFLAAALGWLLAGGAPGAAIDGWLARCILAWCILALGIRIQLTAGRWGWRGLAGGSCCEGAA